MRIGEFLAAYDLQLELLAPTTRRQPWVASIGNSDGGIVEFLNTGNLTGRLGSGRDPNRAVGDLCKEIRGRTIVLNATSEKKRKEIDVPEELVL